MLARPSAPSTVRRWRRAQDLFCSAIELPLEKRTAYLEAECASNSELKRYIHLLVSRYNSTSSFLEEPAGRLLPAKPAPLACGAVVLDRFRVERLIGAGGMGEVYAVHDLHLEESIALKRLHPELAWDEAAVARLKHEILVARKVTHPNVCRIFDFASGASRGSAFLTMELLDGETLEQRLAHKGPLDSEEALSFLRQVVDGLSAAHRVGVIHRDLKPGNIMLTTAEAHERVVITDFGLAISRRGSEDESGVVAGTPLYMAPEQVSGDTLSPATDLFALGLVLYEALTGQKPTGLSSITRLLDAAQKTDVGRSIDTGGIPHRWARTILRCIEPDPADRFQAAEEVLASVARPEIVRRRALVGLGGLAAIAVAGLSLPTGPAGASSSVFEADVAWRKGLLHAERLLPEDLFRAIEYFDEAVQHDPDFAAAHAAKSVAFSRLGDYGGMAPGEAFAAAQGAARVAIRLSPRLAEAHAALGLALSLDVRKWTTAEPSFRTALDLNADYGSAHQWLAGHLSRLGRTQEAVDHARLSMRANPVSLPSSSVLGWMLYYDGQVQEAVAQGEKTVALDPNFLYGHVLLARSFTELGDFERASAACRRASVIVRAGGHASAQPEGVVLAAEGCIEAATGATERARELARELERRSAEQHVPCHYVASIYSVAGETDLAMGTLERGMEDGDPGALYLQVYPPLRRLRGTARYESLLRRLGVEPS